MLQAAIDADAEVEAFISLHADRTGERGRRLVVKNGSLPERNILTGAGSIAVTQGRVLDNAPDRSKRVTFSPSVLPSYLRKTKAIEELPPPSAAHRRHPHGGQAKRFTRSWASALLA